MQGTESLQSMITAVSEVSREKGIDPKVLIETMEQAVLTAAKRAFGMSRELEARYNEESGHIDLFQYMTIVDAVNDPEREISATDAKSKGLDAAIGEELGFQVFYLPSDARKAEEQDREFGTILNLAQARGGFGRIAAQTAKQVIIQRIRDAEREIVFNEFKDRKGEIIRGHVRRFERGSNIIVDINERVEAILPSREQTPRESYRPGDGITALLKDIDRDARGPQLILSRADVGLLVKLFEFEVPEIYEGIVRIVAAAREPGARSKIAVSSRDADVDPVGACVGMKGSRVQAVVQELRGEKIDIVPWDRDPARFVCNAIAPAEVSRVIIDDANGSMELVVPDEKLSLAIGRRGQNVRLASQLTGWRLDIIGESKFRQIEEDAVTALSLIDGVDENTARALYKAGFRSLDELLDAQDQELAGISVIGSVDAAKKLRSRAEAAVDTARARRIDGAVTSSDPLSDRERFLLVRGLTDRVAEQLIAGGYRSVEDVNRESDIDRLALKTGLGAKKAREVKDAITAFVSTESPRIEASRAERIASGSHSLNGTMLTDPAPVPPLPPGDEEN